MPWIEVPDFGALVESWVDAVDGAFHAAGDAVFGKDIKYDVQKSRAPNGLSLYTISIELDNGDIQIVQIQFGHGAFHAFFTPKDSLDQRTAAFVAQLISTMQSEWVLDPSKIEVQ